jgi:2-polyprenyl-3-methyl-5-hydroxy-6-metoxy-1,4-benzoquinol methylase
MPDISKFSEISKAMESHYTATFKKHGATSRGVDWGAEEQCELRYAKMLEVIGDAERLTERPFELLDVGCGFGGLLGYASKSGLKLDYTGVDVSEALVDQGRALYPNAKWSHADVLNLPATRRYDYVICNGILTQKLTATHLEMNDYAAALIRKMFALCNKAVAFNVMSTHVNFQVDNLYYRSPVEMLAFCLAELTRKVRLDHAYPLYEYTMYLYR